MCVAEWGMSGMGSACAEWALTQKRCNLLLDTFWGGVQDLREDFSVDFTDNYRRLMGLEGTGQLPAVSAIGMPFDCFTDGDQATRWLLFHSRNS